MEPGSPPEGSYIQQSFRAAIWKYFELDSSSRKTRCLICGTFLAYSGGTSSMRNHVRNKHQAISSIEGLEKPESVSASSSTPTTSLNQDCKLINITKGDQKKSFLQRIVSMCVTDLLPLSVSSGEGWMKLMRTLDPNAHTPSMSMLVLQTEALYQDVRCRVAMEMRSVDHQVALAGESWLDADGQNNVSLTVHYLDPFWQWQQKIITTQPTRNFTKAHQGNLLETLTKEFDIYPKLSAIVSDRSNFNLFPSDIPHIPCFGHILQEALDKGFQIADIGELIESCRQLVDFFSQDPRVAQKLTSRQKQMIIKEEPLCHDVRGRWVTTYLMFEMILQNRLSIYAVLHDLSVVKPEEAQKYNLKSEVWDTLVEIVPLLKPLQLTTQVLSEEHCPALSMVFPILSQLISNHLKSEEGDSNLVKEFKQAVCGVFVKQYKYQDTKENMPCLLASALDPRYKSLRFLASSQKKRVRAAILEKAGKISDMDRLASPISDEEPLSKKSKTETSAAMEILLGDLYESGDKQESKESTLETEMKGFEDENSAPTISNPLEWWKGKFLKYPHIAKVARGYLSLPAMCAPPDQIFLNTNSPLTRNRPILEPDIADKLIFLHKNKRSLSLSVPLVVEPLTDCLQGTPWGSQANSSGLGGDLTVKAEPLESAEMWGMMAHLLPDQQP